MMRRELLELVRREGEILADINASLERIGNCIDSTGIKLCGLHRHVDGMSQDVDGFRHDVSRIVRKAARDAFREERER